MTSADNEIRENMMTINDNQLLEIQKVCLNLLKVFDSFCEENKLLYYVCGGGCIGAVRHHGFIPWDDDIDVMMPRNDYEKLKVLWPQQIDEAKYRFNDNTESQFLRTMWASISDENTTFIKECQKDLDISHGIKLEIIPLDGCPSNKMQRKIQMFWALIHQIYINQEPPISKGSFLKGIGNILLRLHGNWKSRYRAAIQAEKRMSKFPFFQCEKVTELTTRFQYMRNEYPKEAFNDAIRIPFEDFMMPVPIGYDRYLKMAFGNYMELPPESERMPKHDAVYIDTHSSYKNFKGKYYCVESSRS